MNQRIQQARVADVVSEAQAGTPQGGVKARFAESAVSQVKEVLVAVWTEHRVVLGITAFYLALGGLWLRFTGATWHLTWTYPLVWQIWFVLTVLGAFLQYLRSPRRLRQMLTPQRIMGAVLVIGLVAPFQSTFQSLKRAIPQFTWDLWLSEVDIFIHGAAPWTWWRPSDRALDHIDALYVAWFLIIVGFVSWVSWTSHRRLRAQALVSAACLWILAGTLAAWLFASAGPCYYGRVVEGQNPYLELADRIANMPLVANGAQRRLWAWRMDGTYGATSGISAMPSMHVAMAVLVALVVWRRCRSVGALCWLYVGIVQVGSVVLAWHYAIDGYAGAVLVAACWYLGGRLIEREKIPTA